MPQGGLGMMVSLEGGNNPAWSSDGRTLFFIDLRGPGGKRRVLMTAFTPGLHPSIGRPRALFEIPKDLYPACGLCRCYDVPADGQRFNAMQSRARPAPPPVTHVNLIANWFDELRAKVPAPRTR